MPDFHSIKADFCHEIKSVAEIGLDANGNAGYFAENAPVFSS